MNRRNAIGVFASLACLLHCATVSAAGRRAEPSSPDVPSVLSLEHQACSGPVTLGSSRHPKESAYQQAMAMPFGDTGYRIDFRKLGSFARYTILERLHDKSRGVDDSYILFSKSGLSPYSAAYVVTRMLPGDEMSADGMLTTAIKAQRRNAGAGKVSLIEMETSLGLGVEMIVAGRVGSGCFPTSHFIYADSLDQASFGISRFVVRGKDLIEYSLVLKWPEGLNQSSMIELARKDLALLEAALMPVGPQ